MKEEAVVLEGRVEEVKGHAFFTVRLPTGEEVLATVAGRAKKVARRLYPGAAVRLELSPYDLSRGRIIEPATETEG